MRSAPAHFLPICVATLALLSGSALHAAEPAAATVLRIPADEMPLLKEKLLAFTQARLQGSGIFVDSLRAWMSVPGPLPASPVFEVRPEWSADAATVSLPLTFELRPEGTNTRSTQITLAVSLRREVLLASRRLPRGSAVACSDFVAGMRDLRDVSKQPLALPCAVGAGSVMLHDVAARDQVRSGDIGRAPDVAAGKPVRLSVETGGIKVSTTAIALADARVGDVLEVRLQRPARTLRTRVMGPASVQLVDSAP